MADTTHGAVAPAPVRGLTAAVLDAAYEAGRIPLDEYRAALAIIGAPEPATPTERTFAPSATSPDAAVRPARRRITSTFRSRRNHGVFLLSGHVVGVYSRAARPANLPVTGTVNITAGHGPLMIDGSMRPDQARALARALHAAANAAEAAEVRHA